MRTSGAQVAVFFLAAICGGGCGTVCSLTGSEYWKDQDVPPHPRVYGGVRNALAFPRHHGGDSGASVFVVFVDLPTSAVLDTALLPITVTWEIFDPSAAPPPPWPDH